MQVLINVWPSVCPRCTLRLPSACCERVLACACFAFNTATPHKFTLAFDLFVFFHSVVLKSTPFAKGSAFAQRSFVTSAGSSSHPRQTKSIVAQAVVRRDIEIDKLFFFARDDS